VLTLLYEQWQQIKLPQPEDIVPPFSEIKVKTAVMRSRIEMKFVHKSYNVF
jgi:hypothetical protein